MFLKQNKIAPSEIHSVDLEEEREGLQKKARESYTDI